MHIVPYLYLLLRWKKREIDTNLALVNLSNKFKIMLQGSYIFCVNFCYEFIVRSVYIRKYCYLFKGIYW